MADRPQTALDGMPNPFYGEEFGGEDETYEYYEAPEPEFYEEFGGDGEGSNWMTEPDPDTPVPLPVPLPYALPSKHNLNPLDSRVDIGIMEITSLEEAKQVAYYVLDVLEEDVAEYFAQHPEAVPKGGLYQYTGSDISLKQEWSDILPGEPSTMRLYYEEATSDYRDSSLTKLPSEQMVNKECEAHLHRSKDLYGNAPRPPMNVWDGFSQTKEMGLISEELAEMVYRKIYPQRENYKPPLVPSRKQSLDAVLVTTETEDPNVDQARIGPKVKWSKKERLLKPLPENYYKVETFWTGSTYRGEYINRQFNHGFFNYPLMSTYDSEFKQGHIHSKKHLGQIVYPRGDTWIGQWRKGRQISGKITFCDDLEYYPRNWEYCMRGDRRFYVEYEVGLRTGDRTIYNNRLPPPLIPPGCYDTGDGIYDPKTKEVTAFNGTKLRDADCYEQKWILENCRKIPDVEEHYVRCFNVDRLPCSSIDNYVRQ